MGLFSSKPKFVKCSFCGRELDSKGVMKLSDGEVCDDCVTIRGDDWHVNIFELGHKRPCKKMTCNEVGMAVASWNEKKQIIANFTVTRASESGRILVDDNQQVFCIKRGSGKVIVPHRISDIKDFYLKYEYETTGSFTEDGPRNHVTSGYIEININEFNDVEEINAHVDRKAFTQRGEVKKVFESDLQFLEAVTGRKRKPIPNKIKLL